MSNIFVLRKLFKTIIFVSRFLAATFLFFCLAGSAFAQVEITEIMYDLEGGDSGREWVEIYNAGGDLVDISGWWFFEAETNHKLKIISGDGVLSAGEYAVIVSDDVKFYIDNSAFSGDVFDSSFSLRQKDNLGEKLVIRDQDENEIDSVTYDPLWGAKGDGNSLQKVNDFWCAGAPTPGAVNVTVCEDSPDDNPPDDEDLPDDGDTQEEPPATYSDTMPEWAVEPKITAYAGARKRIIIAGSVTHFTGQARGADGESLSYARYIWSFGDGSRGEGKEIIHTYYYPGEYVVVLNAASGGYAAMDRISVEVISANIVISNVSFDDPSFVEIHNKTSHELDLSQWQIQVGKQKFTITQNTFVKSDKKLIFPSQITGLSIKKGVEVNLLYPSGEVAASYDTKENTHAPVNKVSNNTQTAQPASDHVEEKVVIKNTAYNNSSSHNTVKSQESSMLGYVGTDQKTEEKEELIVSDIGNITQVANVLSGARSQKKSKESGLFWGIIGVLFISLVAIYGVLISKEKENTTLSGSEANLYKIIEIEDNN